MGRSKALSETRIPVSVSLRERPHVPPGGPEVEARKKAYEVLSERFRQEAHLVVERADKYGVQLKESPLSNSFFASLTAEQIEVLSELDVVSVMRWDRLDTVLCLNESALIIDATEARTALRVDGAGVKVAVLDSGIDQKHIALRNKVTSSESLVSEPDTIPGDHGTHVGGIIASQDPLYRGIAPGVDLINIKVLNSSGSGTYQGVIDGIWRALEHGAQVINLSLGWSQILHNWVCDDGDCPLCTAADAAVALGAVVVVAAGNENTLSQRPRYAGKSNIRCPGNARSVVTVGAVDNFKELASFSSQGPSTTQLKLSKPNVAAPGVGIMSCVTGNAFASFDGTSMACPHVAAVAALAIQKYGPEMPPGTIKHLVEHTCEPLSCDNNQVGYGLVNAYTLLAHKCWTDTSHRG